MTTPFRGYPRVAELAAPDGRAQINALADALDADIARVAQGGRLVQVLTYTSSGLFEKQLWPDLIAVVVEVFGAGGGSAAAVENDGSHISFGTGGGGGAYARAYILAADLAGQETVTVGAGGAGGTQSAPNGTAGESSSFGAHVTAGGGGGGTGYQPATDASGGTTQHGQGGAPSGTFLVGCPGEGGGSVEFDSGSLTDATGLHGGAGAGGLSATNWASQGARPGAFGSMLSVAGLGVGGGARGATNPLGTSPAEDGADGADGLVIVQVYVQP